MVVCWSTSKNKQNIGIKPDIIFFCSLVKKTPQNNKTPHTNTLCRKQQISICFKSCLLSFQLCLGKVTWMDSHSHKSGFTFHCAKRDELLYSQLKAHYCCKVKFNCNRELGTVCEKALLADTAGWVSQSLGLPPTVQMTLMQAISFTAVGIKNRWCELLLESLHEKSVLAMVGTAFPQVCTPTFP